MKASTIIRPKLIQGGAVLLLIVIWKAASLYINTPIILPSPELVLASLIRIGGHGWFWESLLFSGLRVLAGFCIAAAFGLFFGIASGINSTVRNVLHPVLVLFRTIPAVAVILLALLWFRVGLVPVFVSFLLGFPIICTNVIAGMDNVDPKLLEMASTYMVDRKKIITGIYFPSTLPFFLAGSSTAIGIGWKIIVTSEVLSQPIFGIGTELYLSKIQLETAEMFAWTIAGICMGGVFESIFHFTSKYLFSRRSSGN
ncbi:MAG: ABC transporter permease [Spirochaetia bacterium]